MREILLSLILVLAPLCHVRAQSIVFPGPGGVVAAATTTFTFQATAGSAAGCVTIAATSGMVIDGISVANSASQAPFTDNSGIACLGGSSNTYSTVYQNNTGCDNGARACGIYYAQSASTVGSVVTINANESRVIAFSRSAGSWTADPGVTVTPTFTNITAVSGASTGTLAHSTELVLAYVSLEDGTATFAAGAGWTTPASNCTIGAAGVVCVYYRSVAATTSVQITGTITSGGGNFNATTEVHSFF